MLSDNYQDFLKVVLGNPDLRLFSFEKTLKLVDIQRERMVIIFSMLISLFERAYLLLYDEKMSDKQSRRWRSWEDYMREWCSREDFRAALSEQLGREDPDFVTYLQRLAGERAPS